MRKVNYKKVFAGIIFLVFAVVFTISIINIIRWYIDKKDNDKIINQIDNTKVVEVDEGEIVNPIEAEESNPYLDYIKMKLIDVDFSELKKTNPNVKGWIVVNGTNINYPFVQYTNNEYYLNHTFNNSYNNAGWVFLDYRNDLIDQNNIIYAHNRTDKTMFGTLKNILTNNWFDNKNNHIVKISTEKNNSLWQIFSVYHTPTTSDYLQIEYGSEFNNFIDLIKNRSAFDFNVEVNDKDKILTLSTCYSKTDKMVMHAKLIKIENKE